MYTDLVKNFRDLWRSFNTFLAQKLANKPLTVVGDGKQTRDFTFVTDVVSAIIKVAKSKICQMKF